MKGARPLTDNECEMMIQQLGSNRTGTRDVAMFTLGIQTGLRISELLGLKIGDIYKGNGIVEHLAVKALKDGENRVIRIVQRTRLAVLPWLNELQRFGYMRGTDYLFQSRTGANKPLSVQAAWAIIKRAASSLELPGKVSTHSMRKTYARKAHNFFIDECTEQGRPYDVIGECQQALGHRQIDSTLHYLSFTKDGTDRFIMKVFGNW